MNNTKYNWSAIAEWTSVALLMASVTLSALNWYPANIITGLLGNAGWVYVGISWKKISVVTISAVLALIYMGGVYIYLQK